MKLRDLLDDRHFIRAEYIVVRQVYNPEDLEKVNWELYNWLDAEYLDSCGYAPIDRYDADYDSDVLFLDTCYNSDNLAMLAIVIE